MATGWSTPLDGVMTRVSFGDLRLLTSHRDAEPGAEAVIAVVDIDGWDDDAPDTTPSVPHWGGSGLASGLEETGGRIIRARGFVSGSSVAAVQRAKAALKAAHGTFVVDDRSRMLGLEASVRKSGLTFDRNSPLFQRFTLGLIADDPLRYSTASKDLVNGANVLVNRGDEDAWPVLELVGPHSAISIVHAGGTWSLTATAAGVERTVDLREGEVWQGGVRVDGAESGPPPAVPAGGASWTVSGLGSGAARARHFEAFS